MSTKLNVEELIYILGKSPNDNVKQAADTLTALKKENEELKSNARIDKDSLEHARKTYLCLHQKWEDCRKLGVQNTQLKGKLTAQQKQNEELNKITIPWDAVKADLKLTAHETLMEKVENHLKDFDSQLAYKAIEEFKKGKQNG